MPKEEALGFHRQVAPFSVLGVPVKCCERLERLGQSVPLGRPYSEEISFVRRHLHGAGQGVVDSKAATGILGLLDTPLSL